MYLKVQHGLILTLRTSSHKHSETVNIAPISNSPCLIEENIMSKFFFKGRPDVMGKYGKNGYSPKRNVKLGSEAQPLTLNVHTENRKSEIEVILAEHKLCAVVEINTNEDENILELESVLNKPTTQRFAKVPERNEPCVCGSGKKYKKCCG